MVGGQPLSRDGLHAALDALLDAADADAGRLHPDAFWEFVAMITFGRGITEGLHGAGLEALSAVPGSPAASRNERETRAYHLGLLIQLLMDLGRLPGEASVLPANFQHGVIVADMLGMLAGPGGLGEGAPQILTSAKKGWAQMRRFARRSLVGVVRWRMGKTGKTREEVWFDLMGNEASKATLDDWQAEAGGPHGNLCRDAFEAGRASKPMRRWGDSNAELAPLIALANSAPGKRKTVQP